MRALFLYPLNALINSQRDRLRAWTHGFDDRLRFALYNGATPENDVRSDEQAKTPSEVRSRAALRRSPPPLLVTNATMLEYMMVRSQDAPIVQKSHGTLRWVVLDEAHTYLGSSAAEIALLLRRVLHAFGVTPGQVRFIATSATISRSDDVRERLREYLANLAGVSEEQVVVVTGDRTRPGVVDPFPSCLSPLPDTTTLEDASDTDAYELLASCPAFRAARDALQAGARSLPSLTDLLGLQPADGDRQTLEILDHASRATTTGPDGTVSLLPLRAHLFMRTLEGLYACWNPSCDGRPRVAPDDWSFGAVHHERHLECDSCHSLVFPVVFCLGCGEAYLSARDTDHHLLPADWSRDELDGDDPDGSDEGDNDEPGTAGSSARLIAGPAGRMQDAQPCTVDRLSGEIGAAGATTMLIHPAARNDGHHQCGRCGDREGETRELFRPARAGASFFLGVALPTVLAKVQPETDEVSRPAGGRKLITFTDSRGGAARFALKAQLEAERNYVRSVIYHRLWEVARRAGPSPAQLAVLAGLDEPLRSQVAQSFSPPAPAETGENWASLKRYLSADVVVRDWMRKSLRARFPPADLDDGDMAEIVLARELLRRPKRQNSLETLGLAQLRYPVLDAVSEAPSLWEERGRTVAEWRDFLTILVDFFVRSHGAVLSGLESALLRWLGVRHSHPVIVPAGEVGEKNRKYAWPQVVERRRPPRMARLLELGLQLDLSEPGNRDIANDLLRRAWSIIHRSVLEQSAEGFRLDLARVAQVAPLETGYLCPVTRRVLPRTLLGRSPYQTAGWTAQDVCQPILMPRPVFPFGTSEGARAPERVREWLGSDPIVREARRAGAWTDFCDQIAGDPASLYLQVGEHSAQQSKRRLEELEDSFKHGNTNILSCSTTMEMGVNLGGLMAVGMNNAPPGPANYLQRAGRAARRQQPRAVVFTMCQGTPHGEGIYKNPMWPFEARLNTPSVSLRSERIILRHVHSVLLAQFLRVLGTTDAHVLKCGSFFGTEDPTSSLAERFRAWLQGEAATDEDLMRAVAGVTARTPIEISPAALADEAAGRFGDVTNRWRGQREALRADLARLTGGQPRSTLAARAVEMQLRRLDDEYLLRHLASEGFLPAYGFPLRVVPFITTTAEQLRYENARRQERDQEREREREDAWGRVRGYPSRHVSVAIQEYAPGSGVVIDGLVYESRGVTLAWQRPPSDGDHRELQSLRLAWRCRSCDAADAIPSGLDVSTCPRCQATDLERIKYLVPAGFAVDIRAKPHNDLSRVLYIPRSRPWLSAGGGPWLPLSTAAVGHYRYDPDGLVLHHNWGAHRHGYAICLHCGYAVPEIAARDEATEPPPGFSGHKRLRGGSDDDRSECDVDLAGGSVQRHRALGADMRTDVVEVQLVQPGHGYLADETVATSLAVALREALARHLNVDAREIGWSVRRARRSGDGRFRLVFFDVADGGAGYVGHLPEAFPRLLEEARRVLDCPRGCDRACHGCLLAFDTSDVADQLDRHRTQTYLSADLLRLAELPAHEQVFGLGTAFETNPLTTALLVATESATVSAVRVHVAGDAADAELDASWPLWSHLQRWQLGGVQVTVVAPRQLLADLDWQEANALAGFLQATGVRLRSVADAVAAGDRLIAAVVRRGDREQSWAVDRPEMLLPGPEWGRPVDGSSSVRSAWEQCVAEPGMEVVPPQLRRPVPGTMRLVEPHKALDGNLSGFGARFWGIIERQAPRLAAKLSEDSKLASIEYSDRYVRSPLSARILSEVIRTLTQRRGGVGATTRIDVRTGPEDPRGRSISAIPRRIHASWPNQRDQQAVLHGVLSSFATTVIVDVTSAGLPHHRYLRLVWPDGRFAELRLDQGLSYMRAHGPGVQFDVQDVASRQIRDLVALDCLLESATDGAPPMYVQEPS